MTIYKDLRLKREERKASWGISWGIYIPSPWVILLSAIWRSPVIPLSPGCSTFLRDLPSLISIGTFHLSYYSGSSYYCQGTSFSSLTTSVWIAKVDFIVFTPSGLTSKRISAR